MNPYKNLLSLSVAAMLLCCGTAVFAQDQVAIKGATIIPVVGDRIENGVILIRDGKIARVGADIGIPVEATVIDAAGKVVIPGYINVHSSAGMSQANEANPVVPFLSVVDSIDPQLTFFEESRRLGVTSAAVVPGNSTMIGGRAVIVKTAGSYVNDMVLKHDAGLKISMAPASGSRMAHLARLRKTLEDARDEIKKAETAAEEAEAASDKAEPADGKDKPASDKDKDKDKDAGDGKEKKPEQKPAATPPPDSVTKKATREAMAALLSGKLPAFIYCQTSMDVTNAQRLVREFGLTPIYVVGREAWKAADALAAADAPIILDSRLVYWETDPRTREERKIVLPKIFREQGAKFLFAVDDRTTGVPSHYHWYQASIAVRYGMPADEAIRTLTLDAAKALGIDEFVGSIEPGKDADLVILSGDPLSVSSWVETTLVDGKVVYQRDSDPRLKLLFEPEKDTK